MALILLYGGTFDPIHVGHLITCRAARELLKADTVLLVPARVSPHKQGDPPGATDQQRLEMIRLAIADNPEFSVDPRELSRPGPSYTIDTVRELQKERPGDHFTLLLGTDQLAKLHTWHEVDKLLAESGIAFLRRTSEVSVEDGLAALRRRMGVKTAEHLRQGLLDTPLIDISATAIRRRVRDGLSISYLVPPLVGQYISQHSLYRTQI